MLTVNDLQSVKTISVKKTPFGVTIPQTTAQKKSAFFGNRKSTGLVPGFSKRKMLEQQAKKGARLSGPIFGNEEDGYYTTPEDEAYLNSPLEDSTDTATEELETWTDIDSSYGYDGTSQEFQPVDSSSSSDSSESVSLPSIFGSVSFSLPKTTTTTTPTSSSTDSTLKSVFDFVNNTASTVASAATTLIPAYLQTNAALSQASSITDLQKTLAAQSAALSTQQTNQQQTITAQQTTAQQTIAAQQQAIAALQSAATSQNASSNGLNLSTNQMILAAIAAIVLLFLFKK